MRTLRFRFAAMLATAAVVPLLTYGAVSMYSLRTGTRETVVDGNLNVARQVAEQVHRYISTNLQIFQALAADLDSTNLSADQSDRILKNYVLRFPEFRELTVVDAAGRPQATSRVSRADVVASPEFKTLTMQAPDGSATMPGAPLVRMSRVFVDGDLLPTSVVATPLGRAGSPDGWLVGEFSIEELWRMVGRIHIGTQGYALVVGPQGELLAHGDPDERFRVATDALARAQGGATGTIDPATASVLQSLHASKDAGSVAQEVDGSNRGRQLAVGVAIRDLDWTAIVTQPTSEAYVVARRNQSALVAAIGLALLIMIVVGSVWGRSLIAPISVLIRGTQAIAEGRLDERVHVESKTELGRLGDAFNGMADRLVELQETTRKQERHAMFGRVAAGLVHDLSHPFKNIQNNCRLMLKMHEDPEVRELFQRTTDREFGTIKRVFEDLRNIARPMPMEHFPLDVNLLASDIAESMRANAGGAGLTLDLHLGGERVFMLGDMFALGRVCRNLVLNAIEATPPQGRITLTTVATERTVQIQVADTGCGIPPERLATMFEDFATTKRQGLGLGLAIVKKIVEQLGGTVTASSEVGRGTTFVLAFERVAPPESAAAPVTRV